MKKILYSLSLLALVGAKALAQSCIPFWPSSLSASASSGCVGSTVSLNSIYTTNPPFNVNHNYQWANITGGNVNCGSTGVLFGTNSVGISFGETSPPLVAGVNIFTLRFTCSNGVQCNPTLTVAVTGLVCTSIDEKVNKNNFSIYPNPANDVLNIELSNSFDSAQLPLSNTTISIINAIGEIVLTEKATSSNTTLNTSNLTNGIYFIKVESKNGSAIKKFIKQ
jgi:hypothetical protein